MKEFSEGDRVIVHDYATPYGWTKTGATGTVFAPLYRGFVTIQEDKTGELLEIRPEFLRTHRQTVEA